MLDSRLSADMTLLLSVLKHTIKPFEKCSTKLNFEKTLTALHVFLLMVVLKTCLLNHVLAFLHFAWNESIKTSGWVCVIDMRIKCVNSEHINDPITWTS